MTSISHSISMIILPVYMIPTKLCCPWMHSWNVGPVHIISIDSEVYFFLWDGLSLIGEQFRWLEEDLKLATQPEQRAKRPWIITMFHHPMYCTTVDGDDCNHHESIVRITSF